MARFLPLCGALFSAAAVLLSTNSSLFAGQEIYSDVQVVQLTSETPFDKGTFELQVLAGSYFSFVNPPRIDYAIGTVRGGWMLYTPSGEGPLRGNVEFLIEGFGGGIFNGPGSALAGVTLFLRYNFVQPGATIVPYFQIGGGGAYSDVYKDQSQRIIGAEFEFNLQASIGLRCFLSERCAFVVEGGYRHISNAGLAERNIGLNSLGGQIGFSYFY